MEAPDLKTAVQEQDWEETSRILKDRPELAKKALTRNEFHVLWSNAPLETIRALLQAWPEAYKEHGWSGNLVAVKLEGQQWDFLKSILPSCPNSVTVGNVYSACYGVAPVDVFKLMLDQQPNAPLAYPGIPFELITRNKLGHFCAVLDRCPAATEVKQHDIRLTPLLYTFQIKKTMNVDWISPILHLNPNAAKQKDFDGKTALHLAYQYGASSGLIDMIQQAYPEAVNERDNLGRFPRDLANQSEKTVFTAANEALILRDYINDEKKSYPDNAVVVCQGDMLIRDPQTAENKEDKETYRSYSKQVHGRQRIFETLLEEFSKMVGVDNKDVIQKAAAIQALAVQYLSNQNDTMIIFGSFENPGYWFQQEMLKLVMRVYHEAQSYLKRTIPSVAYDAQFCMEDLDDRKNGKAAPKPSIEHAKAYNDLTKWLTEGLDTSLYSLQGPVLKPLQSLFNKLFIRRGQTSVSVIGDMVRGTLLVDDMETLQAIVQRINNTFPNITKNRFRQPDKFEKLADFLTYVHDDLNFVPNSDAILPYRFKANSSQRKKDKPLWFNLNFFLQIPEYHRVGFSEMFVACELQIGLSEEINKHRSVHDAYERDRILSNQPLLKNYDALTKEEEGGDRSLQVSNCTKEDNKLIEKVLFGTIATEVLIPCTTAGTDNNILLFESGPFSLSEDEVKAGSFVKLERLCVNSRSLNWFASKKGGYDDICAAFRAAGPYKLDGTKRYFVDSFVLKNTDCGFHATTTVGLYAHVGPYLIQIACDRVGYKSEDDVVVVKSGQNFSYLERMCPVPVGTTALEVIFYGRFYRGGEFKHDEMNLSLKVFDVQ